MKKQMQKGFTLIELMIVVAIIAILAAIAIPQYQNYVARSQATRAMAELGSVKTAVETCMMDNKTAANACALGWTKSSLFGAITTATGNAQELPANTNAADAVVVKIDGTNNVAFITGKLGGNASTAVTGKTIQWVRENTGSWKCETDLDDKFVPTGCTKP